MATVEAATTEHANADNSASVTLSRPLQARPLSGSNARQKRCLESFDRL